MTRDTASSSRARAHADTTYIVRAKEDYYPWTVEFKTEANSILPTIPSRSARGWTHLSDLADDLQGLTLGQFEWERVEILALPPQMEAGTSRDLLQIVTLDRRLASVESESKRLRIHNAELRRRIRQLEAQGKALRAEVTALTLGARVAIRCEVEPVLEVYGVFVPDRLQAVIEELGASRDLLTFTDDWDGQGALGYSEETWIRAARLLSELSSLVAQDRNAVLGEFEIQPGANGALNIDWNLGGLQLLIVVPAEPAKVAQFYGDDGKGERKVRGELGRPNEVQALAVWLRE